MTGLKLREKTNNEEKRSDVMFGDEMSWDK